MTDHPAAVESAFKALEEAKGKDRVFGAACIYLAARLAAADAGYVAVMISKEAVEALREEERLAALSAKSDGTNDELYEARDIEAHRVCGLLSVDLAPLLKPEGQK